MNGIEACLLDLVQVAESPLYSAYRWLGREVGRQLPMEAFLELVDDLVDDQALCLWSVDPDSERRTELRSVPRGLERRYAELEGELDGSFDPFALSLTLGPRAQVDAEPDWWVDFDFDAARFQIEAKAGHDGEALRQLGRLFPDVTLVEEERLPMDGRIRIAGSATAAA